LALTSNLGSLFIFVKSTLYLLGWQKKNFYLGAVKYVSLKKAGAPLGGAQPFLCWVKRANLSTSSQLSLTEISTFCIKNSIFITSTQISLTEISTFCIKN
jgi:hypothetical protein